MECFILEHRHEPYLNLLPVPEINFRLDVIEELREIEHKHVLLLEFRRHSDHLTGGVINTHEYRTALGVKKCHYGLEKNPLGLMVLDW